MSAAARSQRGAKPNPASAQPIQVEPTSSQQAAGGRGFSSQSVEAPSESSASPAVSAAVAPASPIDAQAQYVGAIDQGTSSTRFILFDRAGKIVRSAQRELKQIHVDGKPGWAEHDPIEIMSSVEWCIAEVLSASPPIAASQVASVGLTNQRETTIAWDRTTGQPLHNALVWHDTRTADLVAQWTARYAEGKDRFRASAGLPISTYFSALKIRWLMDNVPAVSEAVRDGRCLVGTVDSWLIWNLSGGAKEPGSAVHVTDVSNASRTMLMNLQTRQWDEENCKEFGIPLSVLPSIRSNSEVYSPIRVGPLSGVPISGCVGDQQSAMLGQLCLRPGESKNTYGTGAFMLLNTGERIVQSTHGLLTTVLFQLSASAPCAYALEGSVSVAGSGVRWVRDGLRLIQSAGEINSLASSVSDAGDVYFVPAFSGLLSPYWRDDARGVICGLTHSSSAGHVARAVLEAAAYQTTDVLDAMVADTAGAVPLSVLKVDGGMCASDLLLQFQADLLRIPVARPASLEATASGAAFAAGLAVGFWQDLADLQAAVAQTAGVRRFEPQMPEDRREALRRGWQKAVYRSFGWIETKEALALPPIAPFAARAPAQVSAASHLPLRSLPHGSSATATVHSVAASALPAASARAKSFRFSPVLSHVVTLGVGLLIGLGMTVFRPQKR